MQSSSWMKSNDSSLTGNFWSNTGFRKRKANASDLDERPDQKKFVTEEKMVKEMQTLSLDLVTLNNNRLPIPDIQINYPQPIEDDSTDDDDEEEKPSEETRLELHKLLKNSFKNDDLQDNLLNKLCEIERKKFTMQIVPYMPIHPAQLTNTNSTNEEKPKDEEDTSSPVLSTEMKNNHFFKIPSSPTPYTVEEPCDNTIKRPSTMKRSFSQSDQSNSNLSVTELKPHEHDYSSIHSSQSAYFIVEPSNPSLNHTSSTTSSSSLSSNGPSIRISELVDTVALPNEDDDDDDIDMQSIASSDTGDKMDDD